MKGPDLFQGEIIMKYQKYIEKIKIFFSLTTGPISTQPATVHPWVKGIQVCSNEDPLSSHKVDNKIYLCFPFLQI